MANEIVNKNPKLNTIWWIVTVTLVVSGIVANHFFGEVAWSLRLAGWIILSGVVIAIVAQTKEGRRLWAFSKEAKIELRKVIWPTRQETVQTTMLIAALVVVMSLLLWGLDSILMWVIGWLTGTKG